MQPSTHPPASPATFIPVLNKRRDEIPDGAVYIGRPSKWGNPFSHQPSNVEGVTQVPSREDAVAAYRWWLREVLKADPAYLDELRGATALVCWCAPKDCHGDVIQEVLGGLVG